MRYLCSVSRQNGFGDYDWEESSFRKACKAVRASVEAGYQGDESGIVFDENGCPLARWINEDGRAVKVNV